MPRVNKAITALVISLRASDSVHVYHSDKHGACVGHELVHKHVHCTRYNTVIELEDIP